MARIPPNLGKINILSIGHVVGVPYLLVSLHVDKHIEHALILTSGHLPP